MDDLYARLIEYPTDDLYGARQFHEVEADRQLQKQLKLLNNIPGSKFLGTLTGGHSLLDALRLPIHTLPYLYTLLASVQVQNGVFPSDPLWLRVQDFVFGFDPFQVRYAGNEFKRLLEAVAEGAEAAKNSSAAAILIQQALLRLDPSTSTFTSLHLLLVRLCLRSRAYSEALPILDNNIYHIAPSKSGLAERQHRALCSLKNASATFITQEAGFSSTIEYRHHLQYHLYGAMLYILAKKWERALFFLEIVLVCPTANTASMIQIDAYKKWVLVCLLQHGKSLHMPRGVNPSAAKLYRSMCKAYESISDAFKKPSPQKLRIEADAGEKIWREDCNGGLITQVISAHQRFAVSSLSKSYISIPLSAAYSLAFPPTTTLDETYTYIADLIATQQLNATLHANSDDPATAVLRFTTPSSSTSSSSQPNGTGAGGPDVDKTPELLAQTARIEGLSERMRETKHRMEVGTRFYAEALAKARKAEAEGKASGSGAAEHPGRDDDLMDTL